MYKYKIILKTTNKHLTRVDSCAQTWLKGLDFICLTDKLTGKYPEISGSTREDYHSAEEKTLYMINLVKESNEFDQYDWLVFIDDDAILNVKKWESIIQYLDKDNAYGLGMQGAYQPEPELVFPSGGSGYFLSPQRIKASNAMTNKDLGLEDVAVGKWLEENNIKLLGSYCIDGIEYPLELNGWFPFIDEHRELEQEGITQSDLRANLMKKLSEKEDKPQLIRKHLTHHYIRDLELMEYIDNIFNT